MQYANGPPVGANRAPKKKENTNGILAAAGLIARVFEEKEI